MPTFDARTIEKIEPPAKLTYYGDPDVPGLKLIVRPNGSRTWVWKARWDGDVREITLGAYPKPLTIYAARVEGRKINNMRAGGTSYATFLAGRTRPMPPAANTNVVAANDTGAVDRALVGPQAAGPALVADGKTCDWMFDLYMEKEGNNLDSAAEKRRMYKHDLKAVIGHKSIFEVTHDDLHAILVEKAETAPIQSNHIHSLICRWFKWACTHGRAATGMRGQINPAMDLVKLSKPNSKDRFLDEYEIALLLRALDIQPTVMNEGWRLCLYAGVRRDEAFSAPFDEFNIEKSEWVIPKERTKTEAELMLPLPPQAMAVVRRASDGRIKDTQHLLWPSKGTHVRNRASDEERSRTGFSKATKTIHHTMEAIAAADPDRPRNFVLKPWSTHDLRRTLSSGMNSLLDADHRPMIDQNTVERILNHAVGGVKGTYNRHAYYAEKKHALALWADRIDQIQKKYIERLSRYRANG